MTPDNKKDVEAIRQWHKEVEDAVNNSDFEEYAKHWSDDMIWMPPNMPPMIGKEACLEMAKYSFEQYAVDQKVTLEEVVVSGDLAYTRSFSLEKYTPKGDVPPMENDGKDIFIYRRQSDGSWLGTHAIWNSNTSPDTSARFDDLKE